MAVSSVIGLCSPLSRTHPHEASGRVERGEAGGRSGNTLSPCPGPWGAPIPGLLQNRAGLSPVSAQASLSGRQICSVATARWHLPPVPTRGRQGMRQCPRAIAALKPDAGKALASTCPLWGLRPAAPPAPAMELCCSASGRWQEALPLTHTAATRPQVGSLAAVTNHHELNTSHNASDYLAGVGVQHRSPG